MNQRARMCYAVGCGREVAPNMLMCRLHWSRVPREIQREVWRTYRPGQESDGYAPSAAYVNAINMARTALEIMKAPSYR